MPERSLYPFLYKLDDKHYITTREIQAGKRRVRKHYYINEEAQNRL